MAEDRRLGRALPRDLAELVAARASGRATAEHRAPEARWASADYSGIVDVSAPGNNTVTFTQAVPGTPHFGKTYTVQGFDTLPGYDLATGLGTIDGAAFVQRVAHLGFSHDRR